MSTFLALAVFVIILALLGAVLGWLSASSGSLALPGRTRRLSGKAKSKRAGLGTDAGVDARVDARVGAAVDAGVDVEIGETLADTRTEQSLQPAEQLVERVNACLPQTQCAQCGHPGCRPYATAIIHDDAPINQCPPGGEALIHELADLLGREFSPLDSERGETKPPQVALIDEPLCIGCTLCIAACPVDAIVGASKLMHTVIIDQCTGCELCLPPCPVDCISLVPADQSLAHWCWPKPT